MIEFIKPKITANVSEDGKKGTVEVAPLSAGYGMTIGNSLRRVLLNSLPGVAITKIMIEGNDGLILHEFTSVPGVKEDVTEIVLNLKEVVVTTATDLPVEAEIDVMGPCEVTDSLIVGNGVTVINPSHHIATVDAEARFHISITFETGLGFVSQDDNRRLHPDCPIGTIFVDSLYTPIRHVGYEIERMRIGDVSDYEKLVLSIETNGVHTPGQTVAYSAGVLCKHYEVFEELDRLFFAEKIVLSGEDESNDSAVLSMPVEDLNLTIRSYHCLKRANINTVEDIVGKTVEEMMSLRSLGQKSYTEIRDKIHELGFNFKDETN